MICPKCGAENNVGATICSACGCELPQIQLKDQKPNFTATGQFTAQNPNPAATGQFAAQNPNSAVTGQFAAQTPNSAVTGQFAAQTPNPAATGQFAAQNPARRHSSGRIKNKPFASLLKKITGNKRLMFCICAATLLLIALIIIIAVPKGKTNYTGASASIRTYYSQTADKTYISVNGKTVPYTFSGSFGSYSVSLNGAVHAAKGSDDALYLISTKKLIKIADSATTYLLSDNGNFVLYTDDDSRLMLYSAADKETVTVSEKDVFDYKFSPDGNVVLYAYEDGENDLVLCKYSGGKSVHVGDGVLPVAVSNNGEYVYAYNNGGVLYCYANNWREKIATEVMPYFFCNTDGTELGFFTTSSKAFVSVRGGEAKKLFTSSIEHNGYVYPVTDAHSDAAWRIVANGYTTCVETGMTTFADAYLSQAGCVYYIDADYNGLPAVVSTESAYERGALIYGDSIVYISDDGELFELSLGDAGNGRMIAQDVASFAASADGQYIYFIDGLGDVWVNNGKKNSKLAENGQAVYVMKNGTALILTDYSFETGGSLYYSDNGGSRHKIADGVMSVTLGVRSAEYSCTLSGVYTVYSSTNGKKFSVIFEDR